jgi:hypothetical protein
VVHSAESQSAERMAPMPSPSGRVGAPRSQRP